MDYVAEISGCDGVAKIPSCFGGNINIEVAGTIADSSVVQITALCDGRTAVYTDVIVAGYASFTPVSTIYTLPIEVKVKAGIDEVNVTLQPFPNTGEPINDIYINSL